MVAVVGLVTFVDEVVSDARSMALSARHEAVLTDGSRVLLLDDRGWSSTRMLAYSGDSRPDDTDSPTMPDIWAETSTENIRETARVVVGPDEPLDTETHADAAAHHWSHLTEILHQQGIVEDAPKLRRLPHEVILSHQLLTRLDRTQAKPTPS